MSRVEPDRDEHDNSNDDTLRQPQAQREVASRTPDKAEGDERTVDEALRNERGKRST